MMRCCFFPLPGITVRKLDSITLSDLMNPSNTLYCPQPIIIGGGCSASLPEQVKSLNAKKALIVTDSYLEQTGMATRFASMLEEANIPSTIFSGVQPDPTTVNIEEGLNILREIHADVIIGLGGGSSIDAAKAISLLSANAEPISQYKGYQNVPRKGVPIIAVPTTAGTGSEVTQGAVITDSVSSVKMVFMDPKILPSIALIDFHLSMSMPPPLTAHVGVDTLTHGIEAFVSRKSHTTTDIFALSCIGLVAEHLVNAWKNPDDAIAREGMALSACHGGLAFSNSSVALVHGMSRPIGALFHVPHGLSNSVLLPAVIAFSTEGAPEKYARIAKTMRLASSDDSTHQALDKLRKGIFDLNQQLEVPKLRDCVKKPYEEFEALLPKMAADALASGSPQNNPVIPDENQIIELYNQAW